MPGTEPLDVCHQGDELFLADLSLEIRHDVLESGSDLCSRINNRFAQVRLVGNHRPTVIQQHRLAKEPHQVRAASLVVGTVAHRASILQERLFALRGQRAVGTACRPLFVSRRVHDHDFSNHSRMLRAAILRAEQVVPPRHGRVKPRGCVASGQYIGLDAESRNEEAVDHVLRGHDHAHVAVHRNVQYVDLALPFLVLELPHPLLAYGIHFHGVARWPGLGKVKRRSPDENEHRDRRRNQCPSQLQRHRALDLGGDRILFSAIAPGEETHQAHNQDGEKRRYADQEEVKIVDLVRHLRGGRRKQWQIRPHSRLSPSCL